MSFTDAHALSTAGPHHRVRSLSVTLGLVALLVGSLAYASDLVIDFDVDPPSTIHAGNSDTFTLEVFEDDGSTANTVLRYFIPAGVQITNLASNAGDPLDCQTGTAGDPQDPLTCLFGTVDDADDPIEIDITFQVDPAVAEGTTLDHDAIVCGEAGGTFSCSGDFFPSDNELHFQTTVTTSADLALAKTVSATDVFAGEPLTYSITVSNPSGPSVARDVLIQDDLPEGAVFTSATIVGPADPGASCAFLAAIAPAGRVSCALGDLYPGTSTLIVIEVETDPGLNPTPVTLTNSATVSSNTADPVAGNDSDSADTDIEDRAVLELRKSSSPLQPVLGETFVWTYEIRNLGPSDARNVEFTDTLPQGLTGLGDSVYFRYIDDQASGFCSLISTEPDTFECRPAGNAFSSPSPYILPAGESVEFDVLVESDPLLLPGRYTNLASLTVGNATFSTIMFGDDVEMVGHADLELTTVLPQAEVAAGSTFEVTVSIDNRGPSAAEQVRLVSEQLADGDVDVVSIASDRLLTDLGGLDSCLVDIDRLTCELADPLEPWLNARAAGSTQTGRWQLTLTLLSRAEQDITVHQCAESITHDPVAANTCDEATTSAGASADLDLTADCQGETQVMGEPGQIVDPSNLGAFPEAPNYSASATHVTAGRRLRCTLNVTNDGADPSGEADLTIQLPAGTSHLAGTLGTTGQGACQLGSPGDPSQPFTCTVGGLPAAGSFDVTFDLLVSPDQAAGSVLVQDAVVETTSDLDPTNNQTSTQMIVETWADTEITLLSIGDAITDWDSALRRPVLETLPGQVSPGLGMRYLVTVQNNGPSASQNTQILGLMPGQQDTGLDHDPLQMTDLGDSCQDGSFLQEFGVFGPGGGQFGQVLWCNLGTLPSGARRTVEWFAASDPAVPDGFDLTAGTFVWWGAASPPAAPGGFLGFPFPQIPPELPTTNDPDLDNNFGDTDTTTSVVADLSIETTVASRALIQSGETFGLTVTITNEGPSAARDVALDVEYPLDEGTPALSYVDSEQLVPPPSEVVPTCIEGAGTLNCTFSPGDLSPGEQLVLDIGLMVREDIFGDPVLDIVSETSTSETDHHVGNDEDTVALSINGLAGDFFTELFPEGTQDLDGIALRLTPDAGPSSYSACVEPTIGPIAPDGSATFLVLGDDDFKPVSLGGGKEVRFYGAKHSTVWVGSNGFLTFGAGDLEYRPTLENHFDLERLAPLFTDLDPSIGGDVWWMQMDDRLVVSFDAVPHVDPLFGTQTFQVWMFFDGRIFVLYDALTGADALSGLSQGGGVPEPFLASDLSTDYAVCPEIFSDDFESGDLSMWLLP